MTTIDTTAAADDVVDVDGLDDNRFRRLAVSDCFHHTTPDQHAALRSDATIERFERALRVLAADLNSQLAAYNEGAMPRDEAWARGVRNLKRVIDTRLVEIGPLARDARRRAHCTPGVSSELRRIRHAVHVHRETVLAGWEPTEADLELWAALDTPGGN